MEQQFRLRHYLEGVGGKNSCSFHLFLLQLQFTDLLSSSFFSIFPVVPCVIEFPGPLLVPNYSCPPMLKIWKIMTGYLRYLKYSCYWLWIRKLSWNIWVQSTNLSESPSLLSSSSIISSLESSESSEVKSSDVIDSSEHSLLDLILQRI